MAEIAKPDAYTPTEVAKKWEQVGLTKATLPLHRMITLAVLAGAFVAFGGMFYLVTLSDWQGGYGTSQVVGGLVFNLGLCLIAIGGAELFTGNTLLSIAVASKKITVGQMARNLAIVWLCNGLGALLIAALAYGTQHWSGGGNLVGLKALSVGAAKAALPFHVAFLRGVLANILVTLAVWCYYAGKTVVDKVAVMLLPITAFVAVGSEHSIANFFFIPYAMLMKATPAVASMPGAPVEKMAYLTWGHFGQNLLASTLGNLIGGALCVGLVYWFAYLWVPQAERAVRSQREAS